MAKCALFLVIGGILTLIEGSPLLLFANRKDIRLIDAENAKANSTIVVGDLDDAAAVDFLYEDRLVFWTDINLEIIKSVRVNESNSVKSIIGTGLVSPDGLACDWIGRKLYWVDSETDRIEVSNLDGSYRKVLFWQDLDQPRAIALDPLHGYMYWTDWGETPKIERAGMDGSQDTRSVIIDNNIYWPNGLTLDYGDSRIYWADGRNNYIHSCKFNGSDRKEIIRGDLPHPFALTLFRNTLYWTDWQTKAIHKCNKLNGDKGYEIVHSNIYSPMDLHVYTAERQPAATGPKPCGQNNGGCSHLCLMSPRKPFYSCACPTGVRLLKDNKTCAEGAEDMLFLARRTDLRVISLDTPDYTAMVLPLENIKHAIAIDYDPIEGYVYWTDDELRTIRRAYMDGTAEEILMNTEIDHPDGLAVDWIGRNLYWTDTGTDRIEVARLNGTFRKVVISEKLDEPRAICLDPVRGYMYWTDWGKEPKIERANLDGSDRLVLINTSLVWPNGVAIDYEEQKLYWSDAKADKIEVANVDGTGRRVLVGDQLPHSFGFTLLGDYIYWTDWQRRSIERVHKKNAKDRSIIIEQLPDLMGLKASKVNAVEGTNDCADGWGCSHLCLYTPKGAICACPMGLELVSDGKTCIVPDAFLLFTRQTDIKRMSLATDHRIVELPIKGVKKAMAIDFDMNDNRIYWTDGSLHISRAFMNGSSTEKIVEFGLNYPEGMAVDWVAHNIYWADSGLKRIEVARLDGSSRRVLVWKNLSHPRAIALDPPNGYMYWTDWSEPPKLERARLDGTDRKVLVGDLGRVYGLTIDYTEKRLYWADIDTHVIETSDLDGGNRTQVMAGDTLPSPMALTQYMDFLYWADWNLKMIQRANKTTGTNRTVVQSSLGNVMDIHVFHHSRQSGWNTCIGNNGGCSHLCLATPDKLSANNSHHCACPTHFVLQPDNKTCSAPKSFLLFSQKNYVSRLVIEQTAPDGLPDVVLPIKGLRNIRAIDYDPADRYIYWISGRSKSIKRARDDGSNMTLVVAGNSNKIQPFDLAIDPYSGLIFWSCTKGEVINVTRTNLKPVGIVVSRAEQKPRYLALNPHKGHLYWTNQASPSTIERSLYDGTEPVSLFDTGLGKPGPITVDPVSQMLFWADLDEQVIEFSDLSGGNRQVLVNGKVGTQSHLKTPRGIAVFGDYLYWVDREKMLIGRVEFKKPSRKVTFVQGRVPSLSDIHVALPLTAEEVLRHPCAKGNGNCSHICMTKTNQSTQCSCPNNLVLKSDMRTCADKTTCLPDYFACVKGDTFCIPNTWRCDGAPDCDDRSDEENCPVCDATQFQCSDGSCINGHLVCDGVAQCPDRQDESSCCESSTQIKCLEGSTCYEKKDRCDGKKDCEDGSDELNCAAEESSPHVLSSHVTVVIIVGVIAIVIIFAVVFVCRRKSPGLQFDDRDMIILTKPLNPQSENTPPNTLSTRSSKTTHGGGGATSALSRGSESANVYDRNHVTGASSSSSAVTQYPVETLNPPPSPVTDRSVCAGEYFGYSSNSPSTVRSVKKHRPRHIPPPPTTPCSTDVCEDSEPYFPKKYYNNTVLELNYDSDPYPPPPTPRSHYFSDEMSCPPSPSTERSYFNPYPPPPSPVANSDC